MPTRTERKLEEAQFFLRHVEHYWRNVPQIDFHLSAFVSAARSVTWVMGAEFRHVSGWQEWYDSKKPSQETRTLLKSMTDLRNEAIKTHPLRTQTQAQVTIAPEHITDEVRSFLANGAQGKLKLEPTEPSNTHFLLMHGARVLAPVTLQSAEHHLPGFKGRDAKDVCREYLTELEALVAECLQRFAP